MNKKIVLGLIVLMLMIFVVPVAQSVLFSSQSAGKFVINKPIKASYLSEDDKPLMLIFFGYVGCAKICTPILQQLSEFYESNSFKPLKSEVGLSFVNLMPEVEQNEPDLFAKSFNHGFRGVYLTQKELMNIDRELGVFFSKNLRDSSEIDHSDNLYLVQRQKDGTFVLKNIYSIHPLNQKMLIDDISKLRMGNK